MTDPLALAPVLPPAERRALAFNDDALSHDARYEAFVAHVHGGGKVEATCKGDKISGSWTWESKPYFFTFAK